MKPHQLIGLRYRLGADPDRHQAADCVSLARHVLKYYGINSPEPTRNWYRRVRRKDFSIFKEQLENWGNETNEFKIGTVALCKSSIGYGLAVYWENGWLNCGEQVVRWNPIDSLEIEKYYYPLSRNFVSS